MELKNEMESIINSTLDSLREKEDDWQKRYENILSDIFKNHEKVSKGFRKPENLSVYATVGDRNSMKYYLRFKGQNVAKVWKSSDGKMKFGCINCDKFEGCPNFKEADWYSPEGSQFRSYFKRCPLNMKTKSPEHYVESSLLEQFRKKEEKTRCSLKNIQPVLLQGQYFQMPTKKEDGHDGHIDILARIINKQGHRRLCVVEIKDENKPSESQKIAMSQAVKYATFIATLLSKQPTWWNFFMGHHEAERNTPNNLDKQDIEVVTIMPEGKTDEYADKKIPIAEIGITLHCHSLYYNKDLFMSRGVFEFSGSFLNEVKK